MRVTFVGVGEAFDDSLANTSILVESGSSSILLDCGYSAVQSFWRMAENPVDLDMVYISHFHADHYFGIPAMLVRFIQEGRTKRLTIAGPPGIEPSIVHLVEMAYSNSMSKARFEIFYLECDPGEEFRHAGFDFSFALSNHPMPCRAIRLDAEGKSVFYSGDGSPTASTLELAQGCDLIIQEAFTLDRPLSGHGTVEQALEFASNAKAKACALVHMGRDIRQSLKEEALSRLAATTGLKGILPEPGDVIEL